MGEEGARRGSRSAPEVNIITASPLTHFLCTLEEEQQNEMTESQL